MYTMACLEDVVDTLEDELFEVEKRIAASSELRSFLSDGSIPNEEKKKVFAETLAPETSSLLRHTMNILVDAGRAGLIPDVASQYVAHVEDAKNRVLAETTSAIPLTQELIDKLIVVLEKETSKRITVKNIVDSAILGGLVIRIEGKIIDLSLRRKLNDMGGSMRTGLS